MNVKELIALLSGDDGEQEVVFNVRGRFDLTVLSLYVEEDGVLNIDLGDEGE
jgi:hypothetical protein